jgi:hypothetical protein
MEGSSGKEYWPFNGPFSKGKMNKKRNDSETNKQEVQGS